MATTQLNAVSYGYVDQANPNTHYSVTPSSWCRIGADEKPNNDKYFLMQFDAFPASLKRKNLVGSQLKLHLRGVATSYSFDGLFWDVFNAAFDPNTVTWNNKPTVSVGGDGKTFFGAVSEADYTIPQNVNTDGYETAIALAGGGGVQVRFSGAKTNEHRDTIDLRPLLSNNAAPYITITYDDTDVTSQIEYRSGPQSGYYNPRNSATFSWAYVKANSELHALDEVFTQASATFYWKQSTDGSYTSVAISGSNQDVTIAANMFPAASTIQWYVQGTDTDGTTTSTPVYSFSTAASTAVATALAPLNTVEDGSAPVTFKWLISSADGQQASRTRLWWKLPSEDNQHWHVLFDVNEAITSYIAPGGTFQAGEIQWKIQAFNIDGTEGPWDANLPNPKTFISVAAPNPVSGLAATSVPYSTITWQSGEQQAYQISVDGVVVKKAFGSGVYSYTLPEPLENGAHEITVIVQGIYGYWSQPATITVDIVNAPGDSITLAGEDGIDATLMWATESSVSDFYVYRDGVIIGHTNGTGFNDRLSLGNHSYFIRNKLADGNYTQSNTVAVASEAKGTFISLLKGSDWLEITQSENSASEQSYKYERQYSLRHYSGAVYPVLELAPFEDFSGSYDFACKDYAAAKAFESFRGKEVIIKSRGDVVVVGAMVSLSGHYGDFIKGYTFIIQRIHMEDYIDDTNT